MTKKRLYSVALGALLVASNVAGITVQEVLSHDFWANEPKGTVFYLQKNCQARELPSSTKEKDCKDGAHQTATTWATAYWGVSMNGKHKIRTVRKNYPALISDTHPYNQEMNIREKLKVTHDTYTEKNVTLQQDKNVTIWDHSGLTNTYTTGSSTYKVKPRKKENRPMEPLVVDDWFPDEVMGDPRWTKARFFGTEENAVTNIVSDNEAYITRTISQTGMLDAYGLEGEYPINEPASLLRTYSTHITTDADHVYVQQEITEKGINSVDVNTQESWQSQYTATFKKGRWKGSTETVTHVAKKEMAPWWWQMLQNYR